MNWQNRSMNEQFRTVAEVAEILGVSKDTVRRLFADEPGVIDLGRREANRGKRRYRVLRIPNAVVARLLESRSVK
jgi:DNA-binding transcriptional MerR regulator